MFDICLYNKSFKIVWSSQYLLAYIKRQLKQVLNPYILLLRVVGHVTQYIPAKTMEYPLLFPCL